MFKVNSSSPQHLLLLFTVSSCTFIKWHFIDWQCQTRWDTEELANWQLEAVSPPPPLLSFHSLYLHLVEYYTKSYLLWARICVERVSTDFLPGLPRAAALNFILHTVKYHNTAQVPQQLHMLSTSPCIISVLCPQSSHHTNPILVLISIFDKRASFSASVHICK